MDAKVKLGPKEAIRLAAQATTILVVRGKKVVILDRRQHPDEETLLSHLLGPTGNLRAPTIRVGKTLFIGFNQDAYRELL